MQLCDRYTAAWRLFNLRYEVVSPDHAGYSTHYLRNNHINVTGDKQVDRARESQMSRGQQTAAGIAMLMNEGYSVGLVNYKDCVQIYADIQQHLGDWREQTLFHSHPDGFPPIEDLRAFEALAVEVYELAKKLEPREDVRSKIFDSLVEMNRRRNLTSTNKWLRERSETDGKLKPYVSIVDQIERYVVEAGNVDR